MFCRIFTTLYIYFFIIMGINNFSISLVLINSKEVGGHNEPVDPEKLFGNQAKILLSFT